jgi:ABC-type multidrug transport system fused ATPase/permease subunit
MSSKLTALSKLNRILKPAERQRLWWLVFIHVLINIIDVLALAALVYLINIYTREKPVLRRDLIPDWLLHRNILTPFFALVIFFACKSLAAYFVLRLQNSFLCKVATRLSRRNLEKLLRQGTGLDEAAEAIRFVSQVPVEFADHILLSTKQICSELLIISMISVALLIFKTKLFIIISLMVIPVTVIIYFSTIKLLGKLRASIQSNSLTSMQKIRFALDNKLNQPNEELVSDYISSQFELNKSKAIFQTIQVMPNRFFDTILVAALFVLVFLNKQIEHIRYIDVITIGSFMAAAAKVVPGIVRIINLNAELQSYSYTLDLLDEEH